MERSAAPEQGDLSALGVVLAVAAVLLIDLRFVDDWSGEAQLAIAGASFALVFGLGGARSRARRSPRPTGPSCSWPAWSCWRLPWATWGVLDTEDVFDGVFLWIAGVFTVVAAFAGVRYRSAACTLLAALGAGVFLIAPTGRAPSLHPARTASRAGGRPSWWSARSW